MKKTIKILCTLLVLAALLALVACGGMKDPTGKAAYDTSVTGEGKYLRLAEVKKEIGSMSVSDFEPSEQYSDYVLIKVKDYGELVVVLRSDIAPISVKNFKTLVKDGFYQGTVIHRVIEGFMIQGGGYTVFEDALREKPAENIKGEFYSNGVTNNLKHLRGVLSMARADDMDSGSSQFFIMHEAASNLDGQYAAFGYVLAGMEVVDAIATCQVDATDPNFPAPLKTIVIESMSFVQPK